MGMKTTTSNGNDSKTNSENDSRLPRINISLPQTMKEEWDAFAAQIGQTTAAMIRLAVQNYMRQERKMNQEVPNDPIAKKLQSLETRLNEKLNEFQTLFSRLPPIANITEETKDRLKSQVISLLEDYPSGIEPKNLAKYCGIDRKEMNDLIAEMQGLGVVKIEKGIIKQGD